ncbi:MAG: hypothetical protein JWM83_877 [Candidatus Angelobacter sp.]|nr:hypothetical protein [Candidatus Angelobacter sp.]
MLVELPIFLKQLEEKFPGTLADLQPVLHVFDQVIDAPSDTDLKKAVQAQVAVAAEHFGGILANAANGFCLPAEAAARNLFDLVIGTLYLMKNPHLLVDFVEFGQLTVYKLMQNLRPEEPKYQQAQARDLARYDAEIKRLEIKFGKRNFWHGRQIIQIAEAIGSQLERLYKTQYKTASAICHGSSYPILSRNEKLEWVIGFTKDNWVRYERESWRFGYLMLAPFLVEVFSLLQIRDLSHLNAMFDVGKKFLNE